MPLRSLLAATWTPAPAAVLSCDGDAGGGGWGIRPRVDCPVLSCLRPAGARRAAGRPSSTPGSAARAHAAGTTAAICQRLASDARVRAGGHWTRRLSHKTRPRGTCMRH